MYENFTFIAKKDTWFVEGTEVKALGIWEGAGLFEGMTNETYEEYNGELPRMDGEVCPLDEFYLIDKHKNKLEFID